MRLRWLALPLMALFGCDEPETAVTAERSADSIRVATYKSCGTVRRRSMQLFA